jgi:hypothetical protein
MSKLDSILENFNESMNQLGAVPNVVIGTVSTRRSRNSSNSVRIKDRRKIKYRKFTKDDLVKAAKKFVTSDEYFN